MIKLRRHWFPGSASMLVLTISFFLSPIAGTAQTRSLNPTIDPSGYNFMRVRDAANRPCVTIKGSIRTSPVNRMETDHVLVAENACPKRIAIKACYHSSDRCVDFKLSSYEKKQVLLGAMTNMPNFRFDFTEKQLF